MSSVYTLNRSYKWPLFNFILSDIEMNFAQIFAFLWTKETLEEFSITSRFFGSKIQKSITCFDCSFYRIEVQVITNPPS